MWDAQETALVPHYRVIRYDAQGFGRSPLASAPAIRADDLHRVLDGLGIGRAHLVGLSMGGTTALDFALQHPARVGALVLAASGCSGLSPADAWLAEQNAQEEAALERGDIEAALRVDLQTWLAGPKRRLEEMPPDLVQTLAPMARAVLLNDVERKPTPQIQPPAVGRLGEVRAPTLVLVGDADVARALAYADVLASGIPGARRQVFAGAAHMLNREQPAAFNQAVLDFLRQQPLS
jgi:pimeloyl-ACP methyl ester carboxylesterase